MIHFTTKLSIRAYTQRNLFEIPHYAERQGCSGQGGGGSVGLPSPPGSPPISWKFLGPVGKFLQTESVIFLIYVEKIILLVNKSLLDILISLPTQLFKIF